MRHTAPQELSTIAIFSTATRHNQNGCKQHKQQKVSFSHNVSN